MSSDHPFQLHFETFGKLPEFHSDKVNREALEKMKEALDVSVEKPGHFILLKSPRAGHGKTHILTRLHHELGGAFEFVPLHAVGGTRIDASSVLDDTLRRLVRNLPAAGGLTVLDLIARRLFSSALQPLVNSGEVPCQDRAGALNALRTRPIETFDFHHPGAVTAHWARDNFELLGPRLSTELARGRGLSLREVSFWVDAMLCYSAAPIDSPARVRALISSVFENSDSEAFVHERLVALLGLVSSLMRVILVADEVEGFAANEPEALRFASFLGTLKQSAENIDFILSINDDIWENAFLPRLSDGLLDRLSEVVVELEPLDHDGMVSLLDSRSPGAGEKILSGMEADTIPSHARGLLKEAGKKWDPEVHGGAPSAPVLQAAPKPLVAPEPYRDPPSNRVTVKAPITELVSESASDSDPIRLEPVIPVRPTSVVKPPFFEATPSAETTPAADNEPETDVAASVEETTDSEEAPIAAEPVAEAPPELPERSPFIVSAPEVAAESEYSVADSTAKESFTGFGTPAPSFSQLDESTIKESFSEPEENFSQPVEGFSQPQESFSQPQESFSQQGEEPKSDKEYPSEGVFTQTESDQNPFSVTEPEEADPVAAFAAKVPEPPVEDTPAPFFVPPAQEASVAAFQAPLEREVPQERPSPVNPPAAAEPVPYSFQAAPTAPPAASIAAFPPRPAQIPPAARQPIEPQPPIQIQKSKSDGPKPDPLDGRTMRVDNLLRQYRERYGDS